MNFSLNKRYWSFGYKTLLKGRAFSPQATIASKYKKKLRHLDYDLQIFKKSTVYDIWKSFNDPDTYAIFLVSHMNGLSIADANNLPIKIDTYEALPNLARFYFVGCNSESHASKYQLMYPHVETWGTDDIVEVMDASKKAISEFLENHSPLPDYDLRGEECMDDIGEEPARIAITRPYSARSGNMVVSAIFADGKEKVLAVMPESSCKKEQTLTIERLLPQRLRFISLRCRSKNSEHVRIEYNGINISASKDRNGKVFGNASGLFLYPFPKDL